MAAVREERGTRQRRDICLFKGVPLFLADLTRALIKLQRGEQTFRIAEEGPLYCQLLEYLIPRRFKMGRLIHILAEF